MPKAVRTLDGLIILLVIVVAVFLVAVLRPVNGTDHDKTQCMNNVRQLAGLLFVASKHPPHAGPELLLYFVTKGTLDPARGEHLEILFCPGDPKESLDRAGGPDAYRDLDLAKGGAGGLTSYAGRALGDPACAVPGGDAPPVVLLCDDGADHHGGRGIVVGLSSGAAKWRDRADHYDGAEIVLGPGSGIEELRCLRAE